LGFGGGIVADDGGRRDLADLGADDFDFDVPQLGGLIGGGPGAFILGGLGGLLLGFGGWFCGLGSGAGGSLAGSGV